MKKTAQRQRQKEKKRRPKATATFQVELPVEVDEHQASLLSAHFEAARHLYNAILSEGQRRLRRMRADPDWQAARAIPHSHKEARSQAYRALREKHRFSDYAFQAAVKDLRVGHLAEHVEAVIAQVLATRAYRALNRVALGQARRVRFRSRGRGLGSVENKRNDTGLRFAFVDLPIEAPSTPALPAGRGAAKRARRARNRQLQEERKLGGHRSA